MTTAYSYDGRYRLTQAENKILDIVAKRYTYTYDDADNRLSKVVCIPEIMTTTYVYEYNDANELTKQSVGGTDTTFAYDAWGRMTSKAQGESYSATYAYRYGDKLKSVTSDFPGEGTVTYEYGGDSKRRERSVSGGAYTWYNWDVGWNVINEDSSKQGTLTMTYVRGLQGIMADVSGSNPASGTYRYYCHDNLGSTRRLRGQNKSSLGVYEYTPYGEIYSESGAAITHKFTGKAWDSTAQLYYFPYRYYSPSAARWLTRDPLGMVDGPNIYAYVTGNPLKFSDRLGLKSTDELLCQGARAQAFSSCLTWITVILGEIGVAAFTCTACLVCLGSGGIVAPSCLGCIGCLVAIIGVRKMGEVNDILEKNCRDALAQVNNCCSTE